MQKATSKNEQRTVLAALTEEWWQYGLACCWRQHASLSVKTVGVKWPVSIYAGGRCL